MEPTQINQSNQLAQSVNAEPEPSAPSSSVVPFKNQKSKVAIWCLSIIAVLAIITAVIFACLYLSNISSQGQPQPQPQSQSQSQSQIQIDDIPSSPEPTVEEVEITNVDTINELDEIIAILFYREKIEPTIRIGNSIYEKDMELIKNGDLDQTSKAGHIVNSLFSKTLTEEETLAALAQSGYTGEEEASWFRQSNAVGADGEAVRAKYKKVFGSDLERGAQASYYCGAYQYQAQYDFYYSDILGCGGLTSYRRFYYKNKYTSDSNHAYVYVSTALLLDENNKVYCDVVDYMDNYNDAQVCAELTDDDVESFDLNESNYLIFSQYRFVFNKADDGTYYFEKVEKL